MRMILDQQLIYPPIEEAVRKAFQLISPRTGIIRNLWLTEGGMEDPELYHVLAEPSDITPFNSGIPAANQGIGCGKTREDAAIRAIGECVERYCGALCRSDELETASFDNWNERGVAAVDIERLCLYSEDQHRIPDFPFRRLQRDTQIAWTPGWSLSRSRPAALPAPFVYVPYDFANEEIDKPTHMPISTGLAAGPNLQTAILKGIMEIIERDAFMIAWHHRLPATPINLDELEFQSVHDLIIRSNRTGGTWYTCQLPSEFPLPIVMALLINKEGLPKTAFGTCAALTVEQALLGAMGECLLTRMFINYLIASDTLKHITRYSEVRTLADHAAVHALSDELRQYLLDYYNQAIACRRDSHFVCHSFGSTETLRPIVEMITDLGFEIFAADLTSPDVAAAGFSVARVIIPGLQPLDNDHVYPYLGGDRLRTAPNRMGFSGYHPSSFFPNPLPHPFP